MLLSKITLLIAEQEMSGVLVPPVAGNVLLLSSIFLCLEWFWAYRFYEIAQIAKAQKVA